MTPPKAVAANDKKLTWVKRVRILLADLIAGKDVDRTRLHKIAEEIDQATVKHKLVPIKSLSVKDVQTSLGLKPLGYEDEFKHILPINPPKLMNAHLRLIEAASKRSPKTEATVRWIIDTLLLHALDIAAARGLPGRRLNIRMERSYTHGPVTLKREKVMLSGRPDYGIWYGEFEELALNVLLVEAKNVDIVDGGVAQALGYMACIHRQRKEKSKKDCSVYGLTTNGETFWFLKISNDSKWSEYTFTSRVYDYSLPLGIMVHMFKKATIMSPSHSKESSTHSHGHEDSTESTTALQSVQEESETDDEMPDVC